MKITIFVSQLTGGGAERVASNLANHLSKCGHDIVLLTKYNTSSDYPIDNHIVVKSLSASSARDVNRKLILYLLRNKPDCYLALPYDSAISILSVRLFAKAPVIVSERNDPALYPEQIKQKLWKLMPKADGIVFQTEYAHHFYQPAIKRCIYAVIPNSIQGCFYQNQKNNRRETRIVSIGRLKKAKNFPMLIEAFSIVHSFFPEYSLEIFGKGPDEELLRSIISDLNLSDSVKIMGFSDNLPERIQSASLFVLPSNREGMPNALMEAMASGLPCITTDCGGGIHSLIQNQDNGLIVPVNDAKAMADAILYCIRNPLAAESFAQNARRCADEYNEGTIYPKWDQALSDMLINKRKHHIFQPENSLNL